MLSSPNRKCETVRLPAVGVFEIPMGCTAQSEEWYFQASFRKDLQRQWVSGGVPSLRQIPSLEFADAATGQVLLNTEELSEEVRGQLQQVLHRNGQLRGASTKMVHQMRDLSADDHERAVMDNQKISARYPWKLLVVIGVAIFLRRLVRAMEIAWKGSSGLQTRCPCGRTGTPPDSRREGNRRRAVCVMGGRR